MLLQRGVCGKFVRHTNLMQIQTENYSKIIEETKAAGATLIAVSKTKPVEAIQALYNLGHRDFGENYVQEMVSKQAVLPPDIRWHFIGHLQSNKVKLIAPIVHLIHSVDSTKLLKEINKAAAKTNRVVDVLLQVHIAQEETKFGFDEKELKDTNFKHGFHELKNVNVAGLMGMASFSNNADLVRTEFKTLKKIYDNLSAVEIPNCRLQTLSMGMSGDYKIALEEGSTMIRVGSLLFGAR